ncbi:MAG: histidinol-phosphate transaminase [Gammaproteobacteria bacterium]|nr:MAG: histidinol-phosphate transaminase [Gammaproteobacteria bacterium]
MPEQIREGNLKGPVHPGIARLTPYQPGKPIEELTRELGITDVIKLASNENPRGPGPLVRERLAAASAELSRYPDGGGYLLKQALSVALQVAPDRLTLGNGSNDVLDLAARISLTPGAEAIVAEHAFVVYRLAVASAGATLVEVPARDYGADLDAMLAAVTEQTAIVFLANPNNPTGTWVTDAALQEFLDRLPEQVWVVLDEAYAEYVEDPEYPDGLALTRRYPNLILTRTFSKIHALAALRIGYSVSTPAVADLLNRARQPFNVNALALAAAEAALTDQEFVQTSRAMNAAGRETLIRGTAALGLTHIPSAGNFITVAVGDASATYQALLAEGVIVRPVAEYGLPEHLRVSVGLPEENERFLTTLARVLERR